MGIRVTRGGEFTVTRGGEVSVTSGGEVSLTRGSQSVVYREEDKSGDQGCLGW